MARWGKRIDDFEADHAPAYPIEAARRYYVTPVGGFSAELDPGEIGINADAVATNMRGIEPYEDLVTVVKVDASRRIPLLVRALFCIVPLGRQTPDALAKSPEGEAVLGPMEMATPERARLEIKVGDEIVINASMSPHGATRSNAWGGAAP